MADSQLDINHVRQVVQHILDQGRQDPAYKLRLYEDPRRTLIEAGLSEQVANHLVRYELPYGFGPHGEKRGQNFAPPPPDRCEETCDWWSCIITRCTWFTGI
jgi:hypothetical protein